MSGGRHLLLEGDREGVVKDLAIYSYTINPPGAVSDPDRDQTTGLLLFDGGSTEIVAGCVYMPHGYKNNSNIIPHLHMRAANGTDPGSGPNNVIRWTLYYKWYSCGEPVSENYTEDTVDFILPPHIDGRPVVTASDDANFTEINGNNKNISSVFEWKLARIGGSDSYPADCVLLQFCIHYTCIGIGANS